MSEHKHGLSAGQPDDEKTIHAEREYSEKKDIEGARPASLSGSESIRLDESNQDAEFALEDDFPDGGLRAWTVVAGVSAHRNNIPPVSDTPHRPH